jgi:hypothetical protein
MNMRTLESAPTTWLKTNHPVSAMNRAMQDHLPVVEWALREGIQATPDRNRAGFYELEVDQRWYYIHIPGRISGIYLIAVGNTGGSSCSQVLVQAHAS